MAPVGAGVTADPEWMAGFAVHAEECGFESIVAVEHAVVGAGYQSRYPYAASGRMELPDDCVLPDPLVLLTFLAGVTQRIGLATGLLVLPDHHPVPLAKRVATLDRLSRGRLRLVVGIGWMREEVEACGADFDTRGRRTDESIDVMRALWRGGPASFAGEFFSFDEVLCVPGPVQAGGVPIHIGGHSAAAARRAGHRGDGFQPLGLRGDSLRSALDAMTRAAETAGRDPAALEVTLGGVLSLKEEAREEAEAVGATRMVLSPKPRTDLAEVKDEMSAFSQRMGL